MVVSNFISGKLSEDMKKIDGMLHINESFDILKKQTVIGNHQAVFYFINGFCQEDLMQRLEESLYKVQEADIGSDPKQFADRFIPYVEVDLYADEYNVITLLLSGVTCFLVDGFRKAI